MPELTAQTETPLDKCTQIPLTTIQKLISRRMLSSKLSKPCFYIQTKADITEFLAMRPKLKKTLGVKVTTNAFYIRTLALAVEKYPIMVASLKDNFLKVADNINVGFAVNAPHGLVVPVIKNAHKKTLTEIAVLEKNLTAKARSNKLALEDMENETIAISNLGVYGIDSFFGIVPPPTSTILTIGSVENLLTIDGKEPIVRKMVDLSLAADNRVINPPLAAKFLTFITAQLQKPRQLI